MSRMLASSIVVCAWSFIVWGGFPTASGQTPPGTPDPIPRPQNAALQVEKLPPQLESLLQTWSQKSAQIQKLQGTHHRFVYDKVFQVEKRAMGAFYYEAPGKGRIDLKPVTIGKGEVSRRTDPKTGQPFKLQADREERWICDGTDIWQVNDVAKQVDVFPIPKENQGQNIMDGPLPFLFGMPPAKAKMRYQLKLLADNENEAIIEVHPRWAVDARNWKFARVILKKDVYLPRAVQLIDPSGNLETTYTFGDFHVNEDGRNFIQKFFGQEAQNPFRPNLQAQGYTFKVANGAAKQVAQADGVTMPSLAGSHWKSAKELLDKLECKVEFRTGQTAPQHQLTYVVYNQQPAAKTPLKKGQDVVLTVYGPSGTVPPVKGLFWKKAGAQLENAGYTVEYKRGQATTDKEKLYMVYEQSPAAGQELKPKGKVTLTVYMPSE